MKVCGLTPATLWPKACWRSLRLEVSMLRQRAGAADVDAGCMGFLVEIFAAGFGKGEIVADERALVVGEGVVEGVCRCRCCCGLL